MSRPTVTPARDWRRYLPNRRQVIWGSIGALAGLVLLIGIAYASTSIPDPNAISTKQTTILYYSDGQKVLGRIGSVNRTDVALDAVPLHVRRAVLAAEDRNYYSEPGISPTGILRALWVDAVGGDVSQGGSTITQQYAKNAYLSQERTFTRKIKEIFISVKLDQQRTKDEVLQDYLNTIYFGRGAYGIQAAAHAYFATDVQHLSPAQGAVLAGLIQSPGNYDPRLHPQAAQDRWQYVLDGMVKKGWLAASDADRMRFPYVAPRQRSGNSGDGPDGFVVEQVKAELAHRGFDEGRLTLGGYKVITTIDRKDQAAAVQAVDDALMPTMRQSPKLRTAVVAVKPGDGAVRAMYGGRDYGNPKDPKGYVNFAFDQRQPGSSFKPYTLVAALEDDIGLDSAFDGSSPKFVQGYPPDNQVRNDSNEQCPYPCTLVDATAQSINTVYVPLALRVGPRKVEQVAKESGVSSIARTAGPDPGAGITLGIYDVNPVDQAVGFATIAAGGVRADPYLVARVVDRDGNTVYRAKPHPERVYSQDVAADAAFAMRQVLDDPRGTAAGKGLAGGRPAAGKTGTTSKNIDAWFIGFTPQLSTAVWVGNYDHSPMQGVPGFAGGVYGGTLPAQAWQQFMNASLEGAPVADFPPRANVGTDLNSPPPRPSAPATSSGPTARPSSGSPTPTASSVVPTAPGSPSVTVVPTTPAPTPTGKGGHKVTASPSP